MLTGGGTGGHLVPFEPIVESLRAYFVRHKSSLPKRLDPEELELKFLGVADEPTRVFFAAYDVPVINIPSGKLRRYMSHLTFYDLLVRLPYGVLKALVLVWYWMPDAVISKGGYGSLPVVLAAAFFRIPVILHESDATPGLANRVLARFANIIAAGWPTIREDLKKYSHKIVVTGTPVRSSFGRANAAEARHNFGLLNTDKVVLVIGGSQGAQQLNELLLKILPALIVDAAVIHITGEEHYTAVKTVAGELLGNSPHQNRYKVFPYLKDTMDLAMTAADVVISRAGATTLAELARLKKACLLVPLADAAGDHQRRNAGLLETAGAAQVLEPVNLGQHIFAAALKEMLGNDELRQKLGDNIGHFDRADSADILAELVFKLAAGYEPEIKAYGAAN